MKIFKKAFIVETNELEGRLDPSYNLYLKRYINTLKIPIKEFGDLLDIKPQYGANETATEYTEGSVRYIRITDITKFGLLKENSKKTCNKIDKKYKLKYEDLLFARSGTVGKCYLHQKEINAIFAGYLIRFRVNKDLIYPKFLFYYTQLERYYKWINAIQRISAQPNINSEEYKSMPIPLPPKEIQKKIIQIMDNAYKTKNENETKAKVLLNSIDEYLFDKLDITLPKEEKIVSFEVDSSDVFGGRLDPSYHKVYYKELDKSLDDSRYEVIRLGNITKSIASGSTPKSGGDDYLLNGKNYFLRLVNLDDDLSINTSKALFIKDEIHNGMLKRSQLQKDDLLFGIAGSIGKMAIVDLDIKANINQAIALLRFNNNVNNFFIGFILNSNICKIQIQQLKRPVAQPNLNITELKSLKIPLPPLNIQNEIASHIQALRDEAKQLKQEAKEVLKKAKDEVESIILGDA